jgi:hypothetical protein
MQAAKLTGPEAPAQKYDLLTALGCYALASPPGIQRLVLRFITLITARYNWRQGLLQVGQREIARLWSVDERTVKREMAKLREQGWLRVETPARRGRVASYALDLIVLRTATRGCWARVGSDFEERMSDRAGQDIRGNVVPFMRPDPPAETEVPGNPDDPWAEMRQLLRVDEPALFATWFEGLSSRGRAGDCLVLLAPNNFHASYVRTHHADRLFRALRRVNGPADLRIVSVGASS